MKLATAAQDVRRSGDFQEQSFKIAANAKAFDILSSKLYTNKPLAIVRELSTNAWDAQVEAGTQDKPFLVHLPNDLAPHFLIRDYGTGLSPEQVQTIYTTYFASTRTDSNDYVGALGLGSKSPFAYTDQFTITSYWNGVAYTYSAFKNETGEPTIALLSEDPTDEPNGVEIRINIKHNDAAKFQAAAQTVYRFFPVRPQIVGARVTFPENKPRFEGLDYALYEEHCNRIALPERVSVVMGNVCYPVALGHGFINTPTSNASLVLFMDIGQVEVAASREELHYSQKTMENIQEQMTAAMAEVRQAVEADLAKHTSLIARIKAIRAYRGMLSFDGYSEQYIPMTLDGAYELIPIKVHNDRLYMERRWQTYLQPGEDTDYAIVENDIDGDLKQSDKSRLRFFMTGRGSVLYLAKIQDHKKYVETFGDLPVRLSNLPEAPKKPRQHYGGPRTYVKYAVDRRLATEAWRNTEGDIDITDAIAVPRQGYSAYINGKEITGAVALNIAEEMGYKKVYGIAKAYYERIRKELGLPDLTEEAKEYAQNAVNGLDEYTIAKTHHCGTYFDYPSDFLKWIVGLSDECNRLVSFEKAHPISGVLQRIMNNCDVSLPDARNFRDEFMKKYPLLSNVNLRLVQKGDVIEYIKLKS